MEKPPMEAPPPYYGGQGGQPAPPPPMYPDPHQGGPMPGPPPQQVVTTVIVTPGTLPTSPIVMQCPNCHSQITTQVTPVNGLLVWLCVIGLFLIGCWLGCCLIPLCVDDLKDVEHRCPQCLTCVGVRKRL